MHRSVEGPDLSNSLFRNNVTHINGLSFYDFVGCQHGRCRRCGACCVAFRLEDMPTRDDMSQTLPKPMGKLCRFLQMGENGLVRCSIHADPRRPVDCAEFDGMDGEGFEGQKVLMNLTNVLLDPPDINHVRIYFIDYLKEVPRNLLDMFHKNLSSEENFTRFLGKYLSYPSLPTDVLDALELKRAIQTIEADGRDRNWGKPLPQIIADNTDTSNPQHTTFIDRYVPESTKATIRNLRNK